MTQSTRLRHSKKRREAEATAALEAAKRRHLMLGTGAKPRKKS